MLKKLKARLAVIALVAIVLTLCTQGTLAYFTTVGTATNVVTSGNIKLMIHETTDQGTPFPTDGVYIVPGDVVSKVVTVENICDHPFYLRVRLIYGSSDQALSSEECLSININSEHWTLKDGWYYFTGIVEPGQTTPHIFSEVEIVGSKVNTSHIGQVLQLTVQAQAVQSENNPVENGDITTAVGWPAES